MTIQEIARVLLNSLIIFAILNAFVQYVWENREELKRNWKG